MTAALAHPLLIQGGMGIGVSDWVLAKAVSMRGHLGVVSGTAIDSVLVRRLQDGDIGGHVRRAMESFPIPRVSSEVLRKYFIPEGKAEDEPYATIPMYRRAVDRAHEGLTMLANYVEVWLAKEGHEGAVGINLLTKVQMPNIHSLYGAMLAGVDYVLMGAGIPREIPGVLDALAEHRPARMRLDVEGAEKGEETWLEFDPSAHWETTPAAVRRPRFLAIISADSLARMLEKKATGRVDGYIIEAPTAGGHNAPPRGQTRLNEKGEPVYGERDVANLEPMRELGKPFWLAGGSGSPEGVREALDAGAAGVQVGTLFAYADESGLDPAAKAEVLARAHSGELEVLTDSRASPTGFPFKVVQLEGTNASRERYEARRRVCDLGYLRTAYRREDGRLDYRCAAEPVETYVKKGGRREDTEGRKCLCNALMADIGLPQVRKWGDVERPLLTSGDDLERIAEYLGDRQRYSADDVIEYLLQQVTDEELIASGTRARAARSAPPAHPSERDHATLSTGRAAR